MRRPVAPPLVTLLLALALGGTVAQAAATATDPLGTELMRLTNLDRTSLGLPALSQDPYLVALAGALPWMCPTSGQTFFGRSKDMAVRGYFSHQVQGCTKTDGSGFSALDLVAYAGYITYRGENIAANDYPTTLESTGYGCDITGGSCKGTTTAPTTVAVAESGFMESPGHRANILGTYDRFGCGSARAADGTYFYTCIFSKGGPASPALSTDTSLLRLGGSDRYTAAVTISARNFAPGVAAVFIATGQNYPDALSAGPAARRLGAPLLLVPGTATTLPSAVASELSRLRPGRVYGAGGPASLTDAILKAAGAYATSGSTRLWGADRYSTSAAISQAIFASGAPVAYVATGSDYPDPLSAAPAAAALGGPLLLVPSGATSLPASVATELGRLRPVRIVIVGSTSVVTPTVAATLAGYTGGGVSRISGADRYATSAAVSAAAFPAGTGVAAVATGTNYPDALAGSALGRSVLLVPGTSTPPPSTRTELMRLRPSTLFVLGGAGSVTPACVDGL